MEIHPYSRMTIELHGQDEIDTMRELLRLAHERLNSAAPFRMRGSGMERRAGLVGPQLFRAKKLMEDMGKHFSIDLPYDAKPDNETTEESPQVFSGVITAKSPEEAAQIIGEIIKSMSGAQQ